MSETRLFAATAFPEISERVLVGPLFRPFAEQLVARLAPHRGHSAIDVACGTGICARVLRERLGPEASLSASTWPRQCSLSPVPLLRQSTAEAAAHDVQFTDGALFSRLNAMAVIGMSDKGKVMSESERSELASRIAADSQAMIAKATRKGVFVAAAD